MSPDTLSHWPPLLYGPIFAAAFFLVALALGLRVLRIVRIPPGSLDQWEHGFIAVTLGTGLMQFVPATLSIFGLMTPTYVRVACIALALALSPDIVSATRSAIRALAPLSPKRMSRSSQVWVILAVLVGAMLLAGALSVRSVGDDDGYHVSSPKRWLAAGSLYYLPTFTHTNASLGFEMLYAIALSFGDVISAKMLHYGAGLFSVFGTVLCGRKLGSVLAGVTAASFLLVATPIINLPYLFTVAMTDFGPTWMTIAIVLLWLAWREQKSTSTFVCMALCAGLAGSFKFTSLAIGIAWAPVLLFADRETPPDWRQRLIRVVSFGAISVVPVLPWLLRNALLTGNPLYPMFSSFIPTRDWSPEHALVFSRYVRLYSWGIASGASLGEGARKAIILATVVGLLVSGTAAFVFVKRTTLRSLIGFAVFFSVFSVVLTGMIFRYWLPALVVAVLAITVKLADSERVKRLQYWPASGLLVLALGALARQEPRGALLNNVRTASGLDSYDEVHPDDALWHMWRFINSQTPTDSRVLAAAFYSQLGASSFGGVWVDRKMYTTDSHLQMYIRLDTWPAFVQSVRDAGITHVLIFATHPEGLGRHGFSFPERGNEYPFCRRLADEFGQKVAQFDELQLYRLLPEESSAPTAR
jgi:hypothetical protein